MKPLDSKTLDWLWQDADAREVRLREIIEDRLAEAPPPAVDGHVVASYFFALRTMTLAVAVEEIAYHATSARRGRRASIRSMHLDGSACCTWPSR
jgi:hypothetical protein